MKKHFFKVIVGCLFSLLLFGGILTGRTVRVQAATEYPLYFGSTLVTSDNMGNLPVKNGKGKASFDPATNTLTLEDVEGSDGHWQGAQIYWFGDSSLKIVGNGEFLNDTGTNGADYGFRYEASNPSQKLILEGDIEFRGKSRAIHVNNGTLECKGNINAIVYNTSAGNAAVSAKNIVLNGGKLNVKRAGGYITGKAAVEASDTLTVNNGELCVDSTGGRNGICADNSIDIKGGVVKAYSRGVGDAISAKNIKMNGAAVYAYSKSGRAIYGMGTNSEIVIQNGIVVAKNDEGDTNYGAILTTDGEVTLGFGATVVRPAGGAVGFDGREIAASSSVSTPVRYAVIKGSGSHCDGDVCDVNITNPSDTFSGTKALWNSLKEAAGKENPLIKASKPYGDKKQFIDYDLNNDESFDIKVEKTDLGCIVHRLGGKKITNKELNLTGEHICNLEYQSLGAIGPIGPTYYLNMLFNLPLKRDYGEYTLNFVMGLGKVIVEGDELQKLNITLQKAIDEGIINTEGTLASLKIDLDKDGTYDLQTAYDGTKTTITWLKDGSLTEDKVISFTPAQTATLEGGTNDFYSSLRFKVINTYNQGECSVDLTGGSAVIDFALMNSMEVLANDNRLLFASSSEADVFLLDLDAEGTFDVSVKIMEPEEEILMTLLPNSNLKGIYSVELTKVEKEMIDQHGAQYYDRLNFIIEKAPPEEPPKEQPGEVSSNESPAEKTLKKQVSENITVGTDVYEVSFNGFIQYDGRKHNGVGIDAAGDPKGAKESKSKAFDIKVIVMKNGEVIDPSKYTIKTKNNKNASISIDGLTPIETNEKKLPYYTIKLKGKEFSDVNKEMKWKKFSFGIIPAELKEGLVTFDKVKSSADGTLQPKKLTFKPVSGSGTVAPKPIKLKFKKQENKTDYVFEANPDGSLTVTGKNNFYGSVTYKK